MLGAVAELDQPKVFVAEAIAVDTNARCDSGEGAACSVSFAQIRAHGVQVQAGANDEALSGTRHEAGRATVARGTSLKQLEDAIDLGDWLFKLEKLVKGGGSVGSEQVVSSWAEASEFAAHEFDVVEVDNQEIASKLAYAKSDGDIPNTLHGIWWLDQMGYSSIAKDNGYQNNMPFENIPSLETLAAFGDSPTQWNAATKCIGPVPNYGGRKGHWTYLNTPRGRSQLFGSISTKMTADICFTDAAMEKITVNAGVLVPVLKSWVFTPSFLFAMKMEKRPWGWDRVTTVGPDVTSHLAAYRSLLESIFPPQWIRILESGGKGAAHYPVLQVIDGNGQRTKYFDEYIAGVVHFSNSPVQLYGMQVPQNFTAKYEQTCYAFTGESCSDTPCHPETFAVCQTGTCVCGAGCSGPTGRCYTMNNKAVATGFSLTNVRWPNNRIFVPHVSTFNQMKVTSTPSILSSGQDKFSLYELPGDLNGSKKFFLGNDKWRNNVATIRGTGGTALGSYGLYSVDLSPTLKDWVEPWQPQDIALTVCSLRLHGDAHAVMIGSSGAAGNPIWAYLKSYQWLIYGYADGSPDESGHWVPDPPFPTGVLPDC